MFFIGIFGAGQKRKVLGEFSNIICKCGALSRMTLTKKYMQFHFFFIPLFKWDRKYFLQTRCCGQTFEITKDYAEEIIRTGQVDLDLFGDAYSDFKFCPKCNINLKEDYQFCPYCGKKV